MIHPSQLSLCIRLRRLRGARKLTTLDLARQTGLSEQTIRILENGHIINPRLSTLLKLARALRVGIAEIIGDKP